MLELSLIATIAVIGTELTYGLTHDSNSVYLGAWLSDRGFQVNAAIKLLDDVTVIEAGIRRLLPESDVIVVTGGLGSTHDDVTREALAAVCGKELVVDEQQLQLLKEKQPAGADEQAYRRQAQLLAGASAIRARLGSAPGMIIEDGKRVIYLLPGVPAEMRSMLADVEADLIKRFGALPRLIKEVFWIDGLSEPLTSARIAGIVADFPKIIFNILAKPGGVQIALLKNSATGKSRQVEEAAARLAGEFGNMIVSEAESTLPAKVGVLLKNRGLTIAVAESITGGHIGTLISSVPGSSDYFLGGVIAYADDIKEAILGVSHETLMREGAVSREAARQMATGAAERFKSSIGLAVTGIAGPGGGSASKPIGLVFIGLAAPGRTIVEEVCLEGNRRDIQAGAASAALEFLRSFLLNHQNPMNDGEGK